MKIKLLTTLAIVGLMSHACNEEDLVQLDPNNTTPEKYFSLKSQIEASLFSGYAALQSNRIGARWYFFINDLRSGELVGTSALFTTGQRIAKGQQIPTDNEIGEFWTGLYRMVHYSNTTLEGIENNTTLDEATLNPLRAEARFLRGWAYNELATHFGGVPLYQARVETPEGAVGKSSEAEVLDFAQEDLKFAAENLPESWGANDKGRATRYSAQGILARSYMQQDELAAAKPVLEGIVSSGKFSLQDRFGANFEEENNFLPESLFEIVYSQVGDFNWNGEGTGKNERSVRAQEYGPSWHNVQPSPQLIKAFPWTACGQSYTDPRLKETVIFKGDTLKSGQVLNQNVNGQSFDICGRSIYPSTYKYGVYYKELPGGYRTTNTNLVIMRYADVLLLLAEVEARTGSAERARELVNQVRTRAGAPRLQDSGIPNADGAQLVTAVQKERQIELALEQIRFRDIKRWRDAGILPADMELSYYTPKDRVLPIPQAEIVNNTSLSQADQNPGY